MVSIPSLLVYLGTFGGCLFWTVLGLLHIFAVALVAISQLWIGEWADEQTSVWGIERSSVPSVVFLCIYAGFLILSSIMVLLREFLWREGVIKPPTVLYAAMLNAAAHAPQTFFDNNPLGRILTRFSRDAEQLDFDVPTALNEVAVGAFTQIVTLASVCVVIPYFTPVAVIVIVALAFLGPPPATLRLRKIADDALSPIHALFSEADSGGSAVSALGLSDLFKTRLIRALDNYNGARYMEKISMEFVRLRGSLVMCVATGIVMFVLVYIRDTMTAATSGFIINQALQLCNFVSFMLLQEGTALLSLNSVDRVVKFTEIEQELKTDPPPPTTNINVEGDIDLLSMSTRTYRSPVISSPDTEFQSLEFGVKESIDWEKWPSCGEVRLIRCCAQYQPELPLVLRDVSVVFEGGRKVGVCGRTGSGKSTLLQVLLRMVRFYSSPLPSTTDPATSELDPAAATTSSSAPLSPPTPPPPAVLIDGVDITTVPLNILRQRVTVIPQEPTVFSGSVAYNLSPEFGLWCRNNEDLMMSILSACEITDPLAPLRSEEENDDIVAMSLGTLLAASCVDYTVRSDANNKDTTESADYHKRCVIRLIRLMARSLDQAHLWTFFQRCCGDGPTSSPFSPLFVELGPEGLLSIGQKQLLCLARAALRRAKLLLLDEATSSVDPMTDKLIQEIVKQRFMGCTVVTIAHRVDTILDCDDVLVLDRGSVLEFNTPSILLGPRNISSTPATTTVTTPPSYGAVVDASGRTEAVGAFAALVSRSAPD
jgi:ABC-type multidrug transport system fused ATPase/permease subunit